jgi:hypothetical protein
MADLANSRSLRRPIWDSDISSIEQCQAAKQPVKLGSLGPGDASHGMARALKEVLGVPAQQSPVTRELLIFALRLRAARLQADVGNANRSRRYGAMASTLAIADAKKSQLDIDPVAPEAVEKTVARFFKLDAVRVGKLREILNSVYSEGRLLLPIIDSLAL